MRCEGVRDRGRMGRQPWLTLRLTSSAAHPSLGQEGSEGCGGGCLSPEPSSSSSEIQGGSPHRVGAGSAGRCPLQVAVEDLLCPPEVLGDLQLHSLTSFLVGVNCGERGSPSVVTRTVLHPLSWADWWLRCQFIYVCLSQLMAPISQPALAGSVPSSVFESRG